MKRILFAIVAATVMFAASADAQLGRRYLQEGSDYYSYHHITGATTDTLSWTTGYKYGDGILVGVVFNTIVAQDTLIIRQGVDTLLKVIFGASSPDQPISIPYMIALDPDSTISIIQKKTSDVGIIYRMTKP